MEEISDRAFQRGHQRLNDSVCPGNFQIADVLQKWATKPRSSATSESTEKRALDWKETKMTLSPPLL